MELIVERHCVAEGEHGLSPLQQALIHEPRRIRIAEAPTGAGKSYAFQRAMRDAGQRVLFIVPTRRLAQNLAAGLIQDLAQASGWSLARAEGQVAVWSSDQTAALHAAGETRVSGVRLRQMGALRRGSRDGEMIIAIPEVVSALLVKRRLEAGHAGKGIFDLLDEFDHIVLDEFHTIEARGFGLAALFARLVSVSREPGVVGYGRAKLSFLSATPLDLAPALCAVGVPDSEIAVLSESVGSQGRALHGDVALEMVDADSLYELIRQRLSQIAAEIRAGNQVVVIYNRLW
jgi:CRISPR-associated endonuclease/helicase Cas3